MAHTMEMSTFANVQLHQIYNNGRFRSKYVYVLLTSKYDIHKAVDYEELKVILVSYTLKIGLYVRLALVFLCKATFKQ